MVMRSRRFSWPKVRGFLYRSLVNLGLFGVLVFALVPIYWMIAPNPFNMEIFT